MEGTRSKQDLEEEKCLDFPLYPSVSVCVLVLIPVGFS